MKKLNKIIIGLISVGILLFSVSGLFSYGKNTEYSPLIGDFDISQATVNKGSEYSTYKEVAEYIYLFKELPPNYMTKDEAHLKGWNGGNPQNVLGDNVYIGGDKFENYEKLLPSNLEYYECDVDYIDDDRGPNRLIYTDDGIIYYTSDHYESYIRLY